MVDFFWVHVFVIFLVAFIFYLKNNKNKCKMHAIDFSVGTEPVDAAELVASDRASGSRHVETPEPVIPADDGDFYLYYVCIGARGLSLDYTFTLPFGVHPTAEVLNLPQSLSSVC